MIKHIVLFNVKEGEDKDAVAAVAAKHLEPLVGQIPGLVSLEVKRCFAGCDFALYSITSSLSNALARDVPAAIAQSFSIIATGFLRENSRARSLGCIKVEPNGNFLTVLRAM